jgi:hypothetical protein
MRHANADRLWKGLKLYMYPIFRKATSFKTGLVSSLSYSFDACRNESYNESLLTRSKFGILFSFLLPEFEDTNHYLLSQPTVFIKLELNLYANFEKEGWKGLDNISIRKGLQALRVPPATH